MLFRSVDESLTGHPLSGGSRQARRQRNGGRGRQRTREARALIGGPHIGNVGLLNGDGNVRICETGLLIGVGVGPGDPELLTLKAVRALESADVVAHFAKAGNPSNARATAEKYLRPAARELQLQYPVTTEHPTGEATYRCAIDQFFDESAAAIAEHLEAGRVVAVLSEGDPLFFGSYMHIHIRLMSRFRTEVIPGVTAMSGCWSAAGLPIVQGDDVLTVLPGTLAQEELVRRLRQNEPTVVMKLGRNLPKVRRSLIESNRLDSAIYVERGTMHNERLMPLAQKTDDSAPYFAIVLVTNYWWQS